MTEPTISEFSLSMLRHAHQLVVDKTPFKICSFIAAPSPTGNGNSSHILTINEPLTGFDDDIIVTLQNVIGTWTTPIYPQADGLEADLDLTDHDEMDEEEGEDALLAEDIDQQAEQDEEVKIELEELCDDTVKKLSTLVLSADHDGLTGMTTGLDTANENNVTFPPAILQAAAVQSPQDYYEDFTEELANVSVSSNAEDDSQEEHSKPISAKSPSIAAPTKIHGIPQLVPSKQKMDAPLAAPPRPHASPFKFPETATMTKMSEMRLKKFGIELFSTPGRTRVWSCFQAPGSERSETITSLTLDDDDTLSVALNQLEFDERLETISCGYLRDYEVIVCKALHAGAPCGYAIPLEQLMDHCYTTGSLGKMTPREPHKVKFCKTSKGSASSPNSAQVQFMKEILNFFPNIVATHGEMKDLRPLPNQHGPILHIRPPVPGRVCPLCDFALTEDTGNTLFRKHWFQHPENKTQSGKKRPVPIKDLFQKTWVQSFDHDKHARLWFSVRRNRQPSSFLSKSIAAGDSQKPYVAGTLLGSLFSHQAPVIKTSQTNEIAVLPFFQQIGAMQHIQSHNPQELVDLIELPRKSDHLLWKLRRAAMCRFEKLCLTVATTNTVVRQLMVAPRAGEKGMAERFNMPSKLCSRMAYALEEVRLLCLVLRCTASDAYIMKDSPINDTSPTTQYRLFLTHRQLNASSSLLTLLSDSQISQNDTRLEQGIQALLATLYMPDNTLDMFNDAYINPVVSYICLRSVHPDGGFQTAKLLTPLYVKTQFGIRLFIMGFINTQYQAYIKSPLSSSNQGPSKIQGDVLKEGLEDDGNIWMKYVEDIISKWVAEKRISPFAEVRNWIRALSKIARNAPAPAMVTWDEDGNRLKLHGHIIDITLYKAELHRTLTDTIAYFHEKVLRGIQLPQTAFELPNEDDYDQTTRGHGLFAFSDNDAQNPDHPATIFMQELSLQGTLCQYKNGELLWDREEVSYWQVHVSFCLSQIYVLLHLLSPPGRGTEEALLQYVNSTETRRHLFRSQTLNTLVLISNYDKGAYLSGIYKCIVRVIQYQVAGLLSAFLRVVRPIELALTLKFQIVAEKSKVMALYQERIFVSFGKAWESRRLTGIIHDWYTSHLGLPIGIHLHRHFAQALQRRLYPRSNLADQALQKLNEAANLALGHGKEAGEMNYARDHSDVLQMSQQEMFERVGKDWLQFLGFEASDSSDS